MVRGTARKRAKTIDLNPTSYSLALLYDKAVNQEITPWRLCRLGPITNPSVVDFPVSPTLHEINAPVVPPGNGNYTLSLWRIGLSVLYRL